MVTLGEIRMNDFYLQQIETTGNQFGYNYILSFIGGMDGNSSIKISLPVGFLKNLYTPDLSEFEWELILKKKSPIKPDGYHFVDDWK